MIPSLLWAACSNASCLEEEIFPNSQSKSNPRVRASTIGWLLVDAGCGDKHHSSYIFLSVFKWPENSVDLL